MSDQKEWMQGVTTLVNVCYNQSVQMGWWKSEDITNPLVVPTKLCLIHSEISEALEGHRKGLPDDKLPHRPAIEVELADAVIRIGDLAGFLKLDLAGAIAEKLEYNRTRKDHTKEVREAFGGKSY